MSEKVEIANGKARNYFKNGYNCAQSVVLAVSDALGEELPAEIIAGTSGFGGGIGFSGEVCGSVNGGVLALGFFLSRKGAKEKAVPKASAAFLRWFVEEFGTLNCLALREGKSFRGAKELCGDITARTAGKVAEIIEGY